MGEQSQLSRIEDKVDALIDKVNQMNGQVARNTQSLQGIDGRGGMIDDLRALWEEMRRFRRDRLPTGTVSIGTVFKAIGVLAAVGGMVAAFMFGGGG